MSKYDQKWLEKYQCLVKFTEDNGHCIVPRNDDTGAHSPLYSWVQVQRKHHNKPTRKEKLSPDRKALLDKIGFNFQSLPHSHKKMNKHNKHDQKWHEKHQCLVKFTEDNGHCIVPKNDDTGAQTALCCWVQLQRRSHNKPTSKEKLPPERKALLDKIGFNFQEGAQAKIWDQHYEKLFTFRQKNGHCRVRLGSKGIKTSLGDWVIRQRRLHRENNLPVD
jgi:hypothetical protein